MIRFFLILALFSFPVRTPAKIISKTEFGENISLYLLANGMRVAFKQTNNEEDILLYLMASGGFSMLKSDRKASGKLAAKIALQSGLGDLSYEALQSLFYHHSIEFSPTIYPFCRAIEASADIAEIDTLLKTINSYFTSAHFSYETFQEVLAKERYKAAMRARNPAKNFERARFELNTNGSPYFGYLQEKELNKANFHTAKYFFSKTFDNPADFVCVIVGNIDKERLEETIYRHLASIPKKKESKKIIFKKAGRYAPGIKIKNIIIPGYIDARTCISFPLKINLDEEMDKRKEAVIKIMEQKLTRKIGNSIGLSISHELPYYPWRNLSWITIQYFADKHNSDHIGQTILREIENMQKEGFSEEDIHYFLSSEEGRRCYASPKNYEWLMIIANYLIWDWDLNKANISATEILDRQKINSILRNLISTDHYTQITAAP